MTRMFAASLFVFCVFAWGAIRFPHELKNRRKNQVAVSHVDRRERIVLFISLAGLGIIPIAYTVSMALRDGRGILSSADWSFSPTLAIFGFVVWIGALWLFYATHRQLKRNWSQTLELREGHTLVTDGVYTLVRHPMYTAFFLWGIAQAFMLQNWVAGLAGIVGFGTLYLTRVNREEAMMREAFGTQYDSYVERTKRIVPYLH